MKEEFLHYVWKTQSFSKSKLVTEKNENLEILFPGEHNHNSGPDFFNAQVKIGEMLWSGNIELHLRTSDWEKHAHQNDDAYDNVILHVVWENDIALQSNLGNELPTLVLKSRVEATLLEKYLLLDASENNIPCASKLTEVPVVLLANWLSRLIVERLENKIGDIKNDLQQSNNDWEEIFYRHLARQFGMKVNAEPFQYLAQSLPFKIIAKHRDNLLQTEALLFGQAGLLSEPTDQIYFHTLFREYIHLRTKYNLTALDKHVWKFMRLRPNNFPSLRIAQLASLFFHQQQLFRKSMEANSIAELHTIFSVTASEFWNNHYRFETNSKLYEKKLGEQAINTILINTIIPFKFLYGKMKGDDAFVQDSISLLEKMDSEENKIIREWKKLGVESFSAMDSQALLELRKNYCEKKNCLKCNVGDFLMHSNQLL